MRLDLPKEWFEKHARNEGDYDIGAGHIDTVAGLEMTCGVRHYTFDINFNHQDGIEVLLLRNGQPRRMALCQHKNDAECIVEALRFAREEGKI